MRRLFFAASLSLAVLSVPSLAFAQHMGAVAPAIAPPAAHAVAPMPMHAAPAIAGHPGSTHVMSRPASALRPGIHTSAAASSPKGPVRTGSHTAPLPKTGWHSNMNSTSTGNTSTNDNGNGGITSIGNGVIVHTNGPFLPTYPPLVPGAPVLLPGNIFSGTSCFSPYSCFPVPGNGFDYEHFFAVHPNWGQPILTAGVVVPFGGGGGFYLPVPYYTPPYPAEQEQAPAPAEQNENNQNQQMAPQQQQAPAMAQQGYYAPSEPVNEYVFVKRDGTRIFAVAYSLTKDRLQYVTKEGLRRTIPLDSLDMDATQKSNEERGNTITLPSAPPAAMAAL